MGGLTAQGLCFILYIYNIYIIQGKKEDIFALMLLPFGRFFLNVEEKSARMFLLIYIKEEMDMKCPFCGFADTKVIDSRAQDENTAIRRRRTCEQCGKRFTTYERIDMIPITIIKRDGTREIFDKNKLLNGILKSCNKRPVTMKQMEKLVDDIENILAGSGEREVESKAIGNMVMDRLKELDEVAYVRFASVYRQFKDINSFMAELEKMCHEKNIER